MHHRQRRQQQHQVLEVRAPALHLHRLHGPMKV